MRAAAKAGTSISLLGGIVLLFFLMRPQPATEPEPFVKVGDEVCFAGYPSFALPVGETIDALFIQQGSDLSYPGIGTRAVAKGIFLVEKAVKAKVLALAIAEDCRFVRIEILDGELAGKTGWVHLYDLWDGKDGAARDSRDRQAMASGRHIRKVVERWREEQRRK